MWLRRIPTQIVGGTGARGIGAVNFKPRHIFASATWGAGAGQRALARHIWRGATSAQRAGPNRTDPVFCRAVGGMDRKNKDSRSRGATGRHRNCPPSAGGFESGVEKTGGGGPVPEPIRRPTARRYGPSPPNTPELGPKPGSGSSVRFSLSGRDCEGGTGTPRAKSGQEASLDRQSEMLPVGGAERKPGPTAQLGFRRPPAHRPTGPARLPEKRRRRLPRPGRPW